MNFYLRGLIEEVDTEVEGVNGYCELDDYRVLELNVDQGEII
jgi:hypothetical protein